MKFPTNPFTSKFSIIFTAIAACIFLTACILSSCGYSAKGRTASAKPSGITESSEELTPVSMTSYTESTYSVYVSDKEYTLSRGEPDSGCYIGSYVLANRAIDFSASEFDKMTEKKHALAVYNLRLGEEYPLEWVLECISLKKTPYIILRPPNDYLPFDEKALEQTAKAAGQLKVPVFIDFYPNPRDYTNDHSVYINFFRKAKKAFEKHSPHAIFVASVNAEDAYDFNLYYPGDDYTDWVGISLFMPQYISGEKNMRDYKKCLDYFYSMYQQKKPIVVNQLAISSFSTADHTYTSTESSKKLLAFYNMIRDGYTRIKAVNYMDFSNIDSSPSNAVRDNFSVTQDSVMLKAYQEAVWDNHFIAETEIKDTPQKSSELYKSYYPVLEDENFKYISEYTFGIVLRRLPNISSEEINGEQYYSTGNLPKAKNVTCITDDDKKTITLEYIGGVSIQ